MFTIEDDHDRSKKLYLPVAFEKTNKNLLITIYSNYWIINQTGVQFSLSRIPFSFARHESVVQELRRLPERRDDPGPGAHRALHSGTRRRGLRRVGAAATPLLAATAREHWQCKGHAAESLPQRETGRYLVQADQHQHCRYASSRCCIGFAELMIRMGRGDLSRGHCG